MNSGYVSLCQLIFTIRAIRYEKLIEVHIYPPVDAYVMIKELYIHFPVKQAGYLKGVPRILHYKLVKLQFKTSSAHR